MEGEEYLSAAFLKLLGNKSLKTSTGGVVGLDVPAAWRKVSFHSLSGLRGA